MFTINISKMNPDKIYLQPPSSGIDGGRSWCQDKIYPEDVEYVRADLIQQLIEDYERRINNAKSLIRLDRSEKSRTRIQAKISSYKCFITELTRII